MKDSDKKSTSFKYHRICKLPSCKKSFKTNLEWQIFHWPECQKEWWRLLKKDKETLIIEIETLKNEVIKIKAYIGLKETKENE